MVESRSRRIGTGVDGLDDAMDGGLPAGYGTLVIGDTGTGKTVLAMQMLCQAAREGASAALISLEESASRLVDNCGRFGWGIAGLVEGGALRLVDARDVALGVATGEFHFDGLMAGLRDLAGQGQPTIVALDGLDVLLQAIPDIRDRRREVGALLRGCAEAGITLVLTAKTRGGPENADPDATNLQYMMDCIIHLDRNTSGPLLNRGLQIIKYRGGAHQGGRLPMQIGADGCSVVAPMARYNEHVVSAERLASGIPRLDGVLAGGYRRGTVTLVSGAPGTSKTTLAAALAEASAAAGEKVLYIALDESFEQICANVRSVGMDLPTAVEGGQLHGVSLHAAATGPVGHFVEIRRQVRAFQPTVLIVDPISALHPETNQDGFDYPISLANYAKSLGLVTLFTSLSLPHAPLDQPSMSGVSATADTWITVSYAIQNGERNRALSVVKARGSAHSNQVRELVLAGAGVELEEVYPLGSEVLMGTSRRAHLEQMAKAEAAAQAGARQRMALLEQNVAHRMSALESMQIELKQARLQLEEMKVEEEFRRSAIADLGRIVAESRKADRND